MPNDNLKKYYSYLKSNGADVAPTYEAFANALSDENNAKKYHSYLLKNKFDAPQSYDVFSQKLGIVKKKETTVSPSVQKEKPISSGTQSKANQKPLGTSVSQKDKDREGFYTLESKDAKVYTGLPGKEKTQYRVLNNKWQRRDESGWRDLDSQNSIDLLNKYFNKTVKSRADITRGLESNVKKAEVEKELSDKELANVLGWSEQEVKKSKAGSGSPDKDFKAAMVKPDMVKPSESNAIGTMAVSTQKAYSDLGPNASSEDIKKKTKYYDTVESQKYLKSIGYDIDVNGDESDEKTKIALNKEKVKQDVITKDAFKAADTYESIDNEINQGLLLNDEEFVVTELRKKYSKDGFYFEETGAGDSMIVKYSPIEGVETRQIEIPLNTNDINNVNALKDFMKQSYMTASERKNLNSEELDIRTQEGRDAHIDKLLKLMADNPYKYGSSLLSEDEIENHINNSYSNLKEQSKNLQQEYKELQYRIDKFNQDPSNPQEKAFINNKIHELSQKELQINNRYNDLSSVDKSINKIASINYNKSKEPGNWIGVLGSQFIQGITNPEKTLTQISMDVLPYAVGEDIVDPMTRQKLKDKGYTDIQVLDYASKELKNNLYENLKEGITNVSSLGTTTSDYVNSNDRSDLLKAASFLAESIGTSLSAGGNPILQKVAFFTQSYNSMEEQMVGPEFDSLNEWQKKLISVPYGFVIGALERYGIAALGEGANPVVNRFATAIVNRTMLSLPKDATVDTIKREINKSVGAMIAQGALKVVGGSLVEGGTEATQQLFEIGEKFLVNKIVGSDKEPGFEYFKDVPDITTADGLKKAFEIAGTDFYYGALGGLLMSGGVNAHQTIKQSSFNKKTDKKFEAFYDSMTDDKLRKLNILNTKIKLKNGEITKEEAKETIDAINSSSQKLKSLNPNLSIRDKKDAFNLMLQRDKLEQEKAPLDEAMQAPYNERITNINNELKTISENAVKESTVEEVTAEGGGIQREGTQEGQPEVGQGEGAVGQAAQPETDLGNRPVEGRSAEEERVTRNVINRPATLSEFGGKTFDTPLQGDTYVDGQQVVFEDRATGRIYELGNIDEVMDSAIPGLQAQEETISITPEGKVSIEGNNWNIQSELPTQGIEYNPAGEVTRVSLKDDAGNTQMFEGQQAVDIAYQIELQKIQSTEQQQFINDLLEQDEEFQTATESIKPRQTEAVVQEETAPDIVPTEPTVAEEVVAEQPVAEETFEDLKTLDIADKTNLQKIQSFLDKLDSDLDKFGKETLGVNLPVALAKTIVKAVKALVKTGVTLEKAIKQIANEYNLSDRDVKSLINPKKVSDIDVNEVRSKDRPGKRISKGISVKTVGGNKVIEETEGLSLEYVKENAPKVFISNANIISKYPLIAGKKKFEPATTIEEAQEIYDLFVREVANNLNYLMDEFKPEFREISTLWYDGANAIANDFADQFGVSAEQAAGIIAAMSPQKDWYQNVRLAEMVLMAYKDNPIMTKEMIDYQKGVNEKGLYEGVVSPGKKLNNAEKEYKRSKTKANKEALDEAKDKLNKAIEKANSVISMLEQYIGKKLNDVPAFVQPYMVRTYHEVNTTKDYNIVAPDGSVQGVARKNDGTKAKVAWGSYSEIGKAVAIYNDGSQENITKSLGEMHKIRNFYNNIIDPMSKDGDVTMDTHAIAAALLLPLSGNSVQVGQNFGTGTSNSAPFGIKGLYYAYADAYALSAKENNLLPRQVQSITWEAIRGLYTDTFKSNKIQVANINNIWKEYQDGKITIDEARKQAKDAAGGIKDPTWARPIQDELGEISKEEGISGRGKGDGRNIVGGTEGGDVLTADTKDKKILKKALDFLDKAENDLNKFGKETLGINIPVATMRAIIKLAKTLVKTGITLQDAIIKAAEQKNVSKKDALNAIKFMSETINRPVKKVIVNEAVALRDQLRLEARAARESAMDLKRKQRALVAVVNGMKRNGSINVNQATALAKRIVNTNLDNPVMVKRMLDYAERLFKRADYQEVLKNAFGLRNKIRKAAKSKGKLQAEVAGMAKKFSKIDPSLVEDIDLYMEIAEKVYGAVRPVRLIKTGLVTKIAADISQISEYQAEEIKRQEEILKNEAMDMHKYLVDSGAISSEMSLKEIRDVITILENNPEADVADRESIIRDYVKKAFDLYSGIIIDMVKTGIDPKTGEEISFDEKQKDIIKRLIGIDTDFMKLEDAYKSIEALDNFIVNKITSGVESIVNSYEGKLNAEAMEKSGIKTRPLKLFFSGIGGRVMAENFASLPVLIDTMFGGINAGQKFMNLSGLNEFANGVASATREQNNIINEYGQKFEKSKPNGMDFRAAENVYERGMLAYLSRTIDGTSEQQRQELGRRINIVKDSIEALSNGDKDQKKISEIYQSLYDKLGLDEFNASNDNLTLSDIQSRADKTNLEATNWWIEKWAEKYSDLSDVSLSVYNTELGSDINYTPDRYSKVEGEEDPINDINLQKAGAFGMDLNFTDKNKTGVLMETTRPRKTPGRYVNLDFDISNARSMKAALVDINTAASVRKIDGFLRSPSMNKIIEDKKDKQILQRRINNYVRRSKHKAVINDATLRELDSAFNYVASIGAVKALGGIFQPIKQTIPVMINTIINAGPQNMSLASVMGDSDMHEWINNSGMAIANRGMEASTTVETANKYLDKVAGSKGEALGKGLMKINEFWLKKFLQQPDVWIARSSFISYYKQALRRKGVDVSKIDWKNHPVDKEAANYAQHMVDRQQNVSDAAMMGEIMASESGTWKIARKTLLPFANFIMNQKSRMYSDFRTAASSDATKEDKIAALRSLGGLTIELAAYQYIGYLTRELVKSLAANLVGYGPDDEEEEKNKKYAIQNASNQYIKDVLSPLPLTDGVTLKAFDFIADQLQDLMISDDEIKNAITEENKAREEIGEDPMTDKQKEKLKEELIDSRKYKFKDYKNDKLFNLGTLSIAFDKSVELWEMTKMAKTGEFTEDSYGTEKTKYINKADQKKMAYLTALKFASLSGALPVEANNLAMYSTKYIKKRAMTENQKDMSSELMKEMNIKELKDYQIALIEKKKSVDSVIEEVDWVESNGGLKNKKQQEEYIRILEKNGEVTSDDLYRIQRLK